MKQTNRQKVERLASQIRGNIDDSKFFTARSTMKVLFNMVKGIMLKFKPKKFVKVNLLWTDPDTTGYTDHKEITLNANCSIFDGLTRAERWLGIKGMCLHEVAHILYTNKDYFMSVMYNLKAGKLLPEPSDEITAFDLSNPNFLELYKTLWNSLEDGFIEYRFLDNFAYDLYRKALKFLRNLHLTTTSTFEELVADEKGEEEKLLTITHMILIYCKYGEIVAEKKDYKDERVQMLIACMPYINEYNENDDIHERYRALNEIVLLLEDYIAEYLKAIENGTNTGDGLQQMADEHSKDVSSGLSGGGLENKGKKKQTPEEAPSKSTKSSASASNESDNEANSSSSKADDEEADEESSSSSNESDDEADNEADANSNESANDEASSESSDADSEGNSEGNANREDDFSVEEKEFEELLAQQKEDAEIIKQDIEAKISGDVEAEMDSLNKALAEEFAEEQLEEEKLNELREFDNSIDYGALHNNISATINRVTSVSEAHVEAYNEVGKDAERVGKTTARMLKQILKDRRNGGVQKGLYFGKSLCPTSYTRQDKRFFQNKKLPTESPTVSVALVIDESGSMSGERINYARFMSLVTYQFCQELGIDLMIIGHTTGYSTDVNIYQYVDFGGCFDGKDKYRILSMSARNCNRDGYALKYAVERTKRQNTDAKLVIIVSDGKPNDRGYGGTIANDDLYKIKADARKAGVDVIAAAIGDDKDIIQSIYGNGYLNISDLKRLPKAITDTIKKYLPQAV